LKQEENEPHERSKEKEENVKEDVGEIEERRSREGKKAVKGKEEERGEY
jgi:hypothetical protein